MLGARCVQSAPRNLASPLGALNKSQMILRVLLYAFKLYEVAGECPVLCVILIGRGKRGKLKEEGWLQGLLEVFGARFCLNYLKEWEHLWRRKTGQGWSSRGHCNTSLNEILSDPPRAPCPELQYVSAGVVRGECVLSTIQDIARSPWVCSLDTLSPPSRIHTAVLQFVRLWCGISVHKNILFSSKLLSFPNGQPILL